MFAHFAARKCLIFSWTWVPLKIGNVELSLSPTGCTRMRNKWTVLDHKERRAIGMNGSRLNLSPWAAFDSAIVQQHIYTFGVTPGSPVHVQWSAATSDYYHHDRNTAIILLYHPPVPRGHFPLLRMCSSKSHILYVSLNRVCLPPPRLLEMHLRDSFRNSIVCCLFCIGLQC